MACCLQARLLQPAPLQQQPPSLQQNPTTLRPRFQRRPRWWTLLGVLLRMAEGAACTLSRLTTVHPPLLLPPPPHLLLPMTWRTMASSTLQRRVLVLEQAATLSTQPLPMAVHPCTLLSAKARKRLPARTTTTTCRHREHRGCRHHPLQTRTTTTTCRHREHRGCGHHPRHPQTTVLTRQHLVHLRCVRRRRRRRREVSEGGGPSTEGFKTPGSQYLRAGVQGKPGNSPPTLGLMKTKTFKETTTSITYNLNRSSILSGRIFK